MSWSQSNHVSKWGPYRHWGNIPTTRSFSVSRNFIKWESVLAVLVIFQHEKGWTGHLHYQEIIESLRHSNQAGILHLMTLRPEQNDENFSDAFLELHFREPCSVFWFIEVDQRPSWQKSQIGSDNARQVMSIRPNQWWHSRWMHICHQFQICWVGENGWVSCLLMLCFFESSGHQKT